MKLLPCLFFLPQSYPDGRLVEPEVILEIIRDLDAVFGRCTIEGPCEGIWKGKHELMRPVRIAIRKPQVAKLKQYVVRIGKRLGQEAMYLEIHAPAAELLSIKS